MFEHRKLVLQLPLDLIDELADMSTLLDPITWTVLEKSLHNLSQFIASGLLYPKLPKQNRARVRDLGTSRLLGLQRRFGARGLGGERIGTQQTGQWWRGEHDRVA